MQFWTKLCHPPVLNEEIVKGRLLPFLEELS